MDLYNQLSADIAALLTKRYSTSFSSASRLFPAHIQKHIYAIYGLVRIADEIVDTYTGPDKCQLLDDLEREVSRCLQRGYSPNPIVHAYGQTARQHHIGDDLTAPFFKSMRMDIGHQTYTKKLYDTYIYGSAEVVGLMCLKVFCAGDEHEYDRLATGARALGAAYQKVNFLRDIAADQQNLHRYYFPGSSFASFDDQTKAVIVQDIRQDFMAALPYINALPKDVRPAVMTSYRYYEKLLGKLEHTPAATIKTTRIRLPAHQKARLLATQLVKVPR